MKVQFGKIPLSARSLEQTSEAPNGVLIKAIQGSNQTGIIVRLGQ
jgi:hypothetical protein